MVAERAGWFECLVGVFLPFVRAGDRKLTFFAFFTLDDRALLVRGRFKNGFAAAGRVVIVRPGFCHFSAWPPRWHRTDVSPTIWRMASWKLILSTWTKKSTRPS